jgi:formate hydrogenlyase subunit 3/multisubunit Na+/H+ antiporter MnhD subunit
MIHMSKKNIGGLICLLTAMLTIIFGIGFVTRFFGTEILFDNNFISDNYVYIALALVILSVVITVVGWCLLFKDVFGKEQTTPEAVKAEAPVMQVPEFVQTERRTTPGNLVTVSYSFCGNCGKRNMAGGNFCSVCGERV